MKDKNTKETLADHGLAPKKRFGQNFLIHQKTSEDIAKSAQITPDDTIIEVGVGLGALTLPLAQQAKRVIGVEIDRGLVRYHRENNSLPENVTLLHEDILKTDFFALAHKCGGKLKIMANLPYSISNPFIFKLIENSAIVDWAVIMLQKEVAERLTAAPSTKAYGIPTVLLGACAKVSKLMRLKPDQFHPRPKIDSLVIRIDFQEVPEAIADLPDYDTSLYQRVVRTAFAQRRKTLENNIANGDFFQGIEKKKKKSTATSAILSAGLKPDMRAENLIIADFVHLTLSIQNLLER